VSEPSDRAIRHVLYVRGQAARAELAVSLGVQPGDLDLARLEQSGAVARLDLDEPRWVLTGEHRREHAKYLADALSAAARVDLAGAYEGFLAVNEQVKAVCLSWTALPADDSFGRWQALETLAELHARVTDSLTRAGAVLPRYEVYAGRLASALRLAQAGQEEYVVSSLVDAYHTVWFELHEDFLSTLGRSRASEGSW
jgi:hypothetical protein